MEPTIGGTRANNFPPVVLQPSDGRVGGRSGNSPAPGDPSNPGSQSSKPYPQVQVGSTEDMFVVNRGGVSDALDSPPVWRYTAKDALESPGVPAVDAFRKLIAESEKQQAGTP